MPRLGRDRSILVLAGISQAAAAMQLTYQKTLLPHTESLTKITGLSWSANRYVVSASQVQGVFACPCLSMYAIAAVMHWCTSPLANSAWSSCDHGLHFARHAPRFVPAVRSLQLSLPKRSCMFLTSPESGKTSSKPKQLTPTAPRPMLCAAWLSHQIPPSLLWLRATT